LALWNKPVLGAKDLPKWDNLQPWNIGVLLPADVLQHLLTVFI